MKKVFYLLTLILLIPALLGAQYYESLKGNSNQRKKNVHSGNQIRTTFFNYGFVGRINQAEDFGENGRSIRAIFMWVISVLWLGQKFFKTDPV